jgi:hypothetical protein
MAQELWHIYSLVITLQNIRLKKIYVWDKKMHQILVKLCNVKFNQNFFSGSQLFLVHV